MTVSNSIVPQSDSSVRTWRWVATLLALSQLAAPPVITRVFGDFLSSGATNEALTTPAGYAFSIWGLITLLCAITCAAALRVGLGAPWETRALVEASVAFAGLSTWLVIAAQDWLWLTVVVFAIMVAALIDIMRLLVRHADDCCHGGCGGAHRRPAWHARLRRGGSTVLAGASAAAAALIVVTAVIYHGAHGRRP